jgi:hypothetical protein
MRITNNTLSGKFNYESTLSGKMEIKIYDNYDKIKEIKIYLLNKILLPAIQNNWDKLKENLLCLDNIQNKLNYYSEKNPLGELDYYKNLVHLTELLMLKDNEIKILEKSNIGSDDIGKLFYKTCYVKLKPEYEIYNLILGKPKKGECYNTNIINNISSLLKKDNISFQEIKSNIENKTQYSII